MDNAHTGVSHFSVRSVVHDLTFSSQDLLSSGGSEYATARLPATRNPQGERHDGRMHYLAVMVFLARKEITLLPKEVIESDSQANLTGTRRGKPALELSRC